MEQLTLDFDIASEHKLQNKTNLQNFELDEKPEILIQKESKPSAEKVSKREKSLKNLIVSVLKGIGRPASINEIHEGLEAEGVHKPQTTVRGRLNENVNVLFKRIARGVYWFINEEEMAGVLLYEKDGRDLSSIEDESVDCIITDHPWEDTKSNKGGNRVFDSSYSSQSFRYTLEDFKEKARVLKKGAFLVENLPAENENNYDYLYQIKKMAEEAGLLYYAKVPWRKGTFVSNTGRKSKNTEELMIFSKGKARNLRPDKKKIKQTGEMHYMSGTAEMLPTEFDFQPPSNKQKIHQAEKPWQLYQRIIELVTRPGEIILDQFAGSGNLGVAALKTNRLAILFEIMKENVVKIRERLNQFASKEQVVLAS